MIEGPPDTLAEVVHAEIGDHAVQHFLAEERLPAHTRIDRHATPRPPCVARVETQIELLHRQYRGAAVLQPGHASNKKIRETRAGHFPAERELASRARL